MKCKCRSGLEDRNMCSRHAALGTFSSGINCKECFCLHVLSQPAAFLFFSSPPIFLFFCFFFFLESISIPFLLLWVEIWSSVLSLCIFEVGFLVLRHHEAVQHKQPFYRSPGPEVRLLLLLRRSSQPLLRALGSLLLAVPTSSCVISQPASPVEEA